MRLNRRLLASASLIFLLLGAILAPATSIAGDPIASGSVVLPGGRVLPPLPTAMAHPSVHAEMLDTYGRGTFPFTPGSRPDVPLRRGAVTAGTSIEDPASSMAALTSYSVPDPLSSPSNPAVTLPNGLRKEVFGFLPYWMLNDTALASMNYDLVSTIAYFSVGANRDGHLLKGSSTSPTSGWSGWNSAHMTDVTNFAHGRGVRVVLTITMMAWDSASAADMAAFLNSSTARAQLVGEIAGAVKGRLADGVNLDFEPVGSSLRDQYTSFVRQLKAGLAAAGAGSYLTVCTTAGAATWATGYDVAGLTATGAADAIFVMGYDFNWSGSARAGAVAPIDSPYTLDVNQTMADFMKLTSGGKLLWGVPYYGRTWPTSSNLLNATTIDGISKAYYYTGHLAQAKQYGRLWDDVGKTPWYRYWDAAAGNWVEGYYDDVTSLGVKYDLVNARGLAGTGMWTLLMDQGHDELWHLLADKFVDDGEPPVGGVSLLPETTDSNAVRVSWKAIDYASGLSSYDVQVHKVGTTAWVSWLTATQATSAWFIGNSGAQYEFRVAAVDVKGNRQPWLVVAPMPTSLTAGTFARVAASGLNVRSGPGTGYGSLSTLANGERVYLLDGPTLADGYRWWRVQFGFAEWPSSWYARTGFVAAGSSSGPYLVPAQSATMTTLDPFVADLIMPASFSPNGDGVQDGVKFSYRLRGPASVSLDVIDQGGVVTRSISFGAQLSGANAAFWDGRLATGAWAPAGRYLLRVTAIDADGGAHVSPSSAFDAGLLKVAGITADLVAPTITVIRPAPSSSMVPASSRISVDLSELVRGVDGTTVVLSTASGAVVGTSVSWDPVARRVAVIPSAPLPTDAAFTVNVRAGITDLVGNRLAPIGWSFRTAPGVALTPWPRISFPVGTHTGYLVGDKGRLLGGTTASLASPSGANVSQRAILPNLPGRWLYVENGVWTARWMRESAGAFLRGEVERATYPATTRIVVRAGTHSGYRFDSAGTLLATRTASLTTTSGANIGARAIINGRPYLAVLNGIWAGYWLPESGVAYVAGSLQRLDFGALPRLTFKAGTYIGYRYDTHGAVIATRKATLASASGANASAWAVINGRPQYLIANGIWSGYWIAEGTGIALAIVP